MKHWIAAVFFSLAIVSASLPAMAQYQTVQRQLWKMSDLGLEFHLTVNLVDNSVDGRVKYYGDSWDEVSGTICMRDCTAVQLIRTIPAANGGGKQTFTGNIAIDMSGRMTASGTMSGTGIPGVANWTADISKN